MGGINDTPEMRSLAVHVRYEDYYEYELLKDMEFTYGEIAPWFDQPGGGTQYIKMDASGNRMRIQDMLDKGWLKQIGVRKCLTD